MKWRIAPCTPEYYTCEYPNCLGYASFEVENRFDLPLPREEVYGWLCEAHLTTGLNEMEEKIKNGS